MAPPYHSQQVSSPSSYYHPSAPNLESQNVLCHFILYIIYPLRGADIYRQKIRRISSSSELSINHLNIQLLPYATTNPNDQDVFQSS